MTALEGSSLGCPCLKGCGGADKTRQQIGKCRDSRQPTTQGKTEEVYVRQGGGLPWVWCLQLKTLALSWPAGDGCPGGKNLRMSLLHRGSSEGYKERQWQAGLELKLLSE